MNATVDLSYTINYLHQKVRSVGLILLVVWLEYLWSDFEDLVTVPIIVILIIRLRRRRGGVQGLLHRPLPLLGCLLDRLGITLLNLELAQFYFQNIRGNLEIMRLL